MAPTTYLSPVCLEITASNPLEAEDHLNAAVEQLQRISHAGHAKGILMTMKGPGRFTVELSELVPYGVTQEIDGTQESF